MSGQAGLFFFDGRPIELDVAKRLGDAIDRYGPDARGQFVDRGLVMVHRALHVTPEDPLERQPYASKSGNVITWDGRLDNRDDLLLQLAREVGDDTTDVALAAAAYDKWRDDGLAKLIGDWSLVVWKPRERELVLASD